LNCGKNQRCTLLGCKPLTSFDLGARCHPLSLSGRKHLADAIAPDVWAKNYFWLLQAARRLLDVCCCCCWREIARRVRDAAFLGRNFD